MEDPILFALAVLTILGTPGPTNSLLATSGATAGLRGSLKLIPAEAAGYLIAILTLGLLLGPAMTASPVLATALRLAVGAYQLLLALRLWQRGGPVTTAGALVTPGQVFVTTLLNPKAIVFALAVVPFGREGAVWPYLLGFLAMLVGVATSWIAAGAALGGLAGRHGVQGLIPRLGAVAVAGFALFIIASAFIR